MGTLSVLAVKPDLDAPAGYSSIKSSSNTLR